jgi:hypothetical protein
LHEFDWAVLDRVDVQAGTLSGRGAIAGAIFGFAIGTAIAINVETSGQELDFSPLQPILYSIPIGLTVGAVAGSYMPKWLTIYCGR